jgi:hypothetical protein
MITAIVIVALLFMVAVGLIAAVQARQIALELERQRRAEGAEFDAWLAKTRRGTSCARLKASCERKASDAG